MKRRRKSSPVVRLKKKADRLWSELIRRPRKCAMCGCTDKQMNAHHLITRWKLRTRWSLENGICLCAGCHCFKADSAHKNPHQWTSTLMHKYPERWAYVVEHRIDPLLAKVDVEYMEGVIDGLKAIKAALPSSVLDVEIADTTRPKGELGQMVCTCGGRATLDIDQFGCRTATCESCGSEKLI